MMDTSKGIIEIFSIGLKPGTGPIFNQLYTGQSVPLQKRFGVNLIAYGPSLHDADAFFVVRHFESLEHRQNSHDKFYGSNEWKTGPREGILSLIDSYTTVVLPSSDELVRAFAKTNQ